MVPLAAAWRKIFCRYLGSVTDISGSQHLVCKQIVFIYSPKINNFANCITLVDLHNGFDAVDHLSVFVRLSDFFYRVVVYIYVFHFRFNTCFNSLSQP